MRKLGCAACLGLLLFSLTGCGQFYLKPKSPSQFTSGNLLYEIQAYSPDFHKVYRMDSLFCELDLATVFFLRITNLNAYPVKLNLSETFALQDNKQLSYRPIQRPFLPLPSQADERISYRQMTYSELHTLEHQLLYTLGDGVTTPNHSSYQSQMTDLRNKLSSLEQQLQISEELQRREKDLVKKLEQYAWKDQLLYPNGIATGIVIFPAIPPDNRSDCILQFMIAPNQIVSVSFSVAASSN